MDWLTERRPDWSRGELLPVVVTDAGHGDLLMLAWANPEAVSSDRVDRRGALLVPLAPRPVAQGRDQRQHDARASMPLTAMATRSRTGSARRPGVPHRTRSCFDGPEPFDLAALGRVIAGRRGADPATSYTARLLSEGLAAGGRRR